MTDLALTIDLNCTLASLEYVVFLMDTTGYWLFLSPSWERITGFAIADSLGKSLFEFVLADKLSLDTWLSQPETKFPVRLHTAKGYDIWADLQVRRSEAGLTGTLRERAVPELMATSQQQDVSRLRKQVCQQALLRRWANLVELTEAELAHEVVESLRSISDAGYVALTGGGKCLAQAGKPGQRVWHLPVASAWGHLSIGRDYQWQQWESDWLHEAVDQIAQTLQAIWKWQHIQQRDADLRYLAEVHTTQLERALSYQASMVKMTKRVRESLDPHIIIKTLVDELKWVLGAPRCAAGIFDGETLAWVYPETETIDTEMLTHLSVTTHYCPTPGRAELICPLRDETKVFGVIWLQHRHALGFDDEEVRLIEQVATQGAIALQQAQLHSQLQNQLDAEKRLSLLKDDFLSTVSHELRTPLTRMRMAIELLGVSKLTEQQRRYWDILSKSCLQERDLIEDLLTLQQFRTGAPDLKPMPLDLPNWLSEQVAVVEPGTWGDEILVDCDLNLPTFWSDRSGLDRILKELLTNARKHGRSPIRVSLTALSSHEICLSVSNPAGLAVSELPHVFDAFYRVPQVDRWKEGGIGLGLALVKAIVERLQGTITIDQTDDLITFTVILPSLS